MSLGVGECDLFVAGCECVSFFWLGVGECDLFLDGSWWVWASVTIFWLGVGGCG